MPYSTLEGQCPSRAKPQERAPRPSKASTQPHGGWAAESPTYPVGLSSGTTGSLDWGGASLMLRKPKMVPPTTPMQSRRFNQTQNKQTEADATFILRYKAWRLQ